MARVFVTGATGFLGLNLIECLAGKGWDVTALHRPGSDLSVLKASGVKTVIGDILDPLSLRAALVPETDYVFHMAADTSVLKKDQTRQKAVNIDGTKNIIAAALNARVRRFVYTSTASVYGAHKSLIDEETEQSGKHSPIHYIQTKSQAESSVRMAAERGLDAVICNPGHIIGRHDQAGWARMFLHIKNGTLPGIPPGSGSFAHAKEVAATHIAAAEKGRSGENYILGGPHFTFAQLIHEIGKLLKKDMPSGVTPGFLIKMNAWYLEYCARLTKKNPSISLDAARFVCQHHILNSAKAEKELGYNPPPLQTALIDCYRWLAEKGAI